MSTQNTVTPETIKEIPPYIFDIAVDERKDYCTVHVVKSWSMFFRDIVTGDRKSDIRSTIDRRYKVGDLMLLREFDPVKFEYTGNSAIVEITYIQQNKSNPCAISRDALRDDYAVLSIEPFLPDILTQRIYEEWFKVTHSDK